MIPLIIPPELLILSPLELLVLINLGALSGDTLKWAKKRVIELWATREYGFTPKPELLFELQKISKSDACKRLKECIGKHELLGLVKLGLRIEQLSDEGRIELIGNIKEDVYNKKGLKGIRILDMGSTGTLLGIIEYLSRLKIKHNYKQADLVDIFEKTIADWLLITIFHKTEHGQQMLKGQIITYMKIPRERFFVFASGSAGYSATRVIAELHNKNKIRNLGYSFELSSKKEDMTGRVLYTWVFEKIS